MGINRVQIRVAVGAVHDGVKLGCEVHRVATTIKLEVWNVGCAIHDDAMEHAIVVSDG